MAARVVMFRGNVMRTGIRMALLSALGVALPCSGLAGAPTWSPDLQAQEKVALLLNILAVVMFMGDDKFDGTLFNREPVDQLGDKAQYACVGPNIKDQVTPDQIALEKQYNVTIFPTIMNQQPNKTEGHGGGTGNYVF